MVETLTKDLSLTGMRCLSSTICPVSSDVSLELILGNGQEPLALRGRTVWFQTIPEGDQFDIGIAFFDVSPHNKRRLSMYIDRLSPQTIPSNF